MTENPALQLDTIQIVKTFLERFHFVIEHCIVFADLISPPTTLETVLGSNGHYFISSSSALLDVIIDYHQSQLPQL